MSISQRTSNHDAARRQHVVYESKSYVVVDDFLPLDAFESLQAFFRSQEFVKLGDSERWNKDWHMGSGPIYRSEVPFWYRVRNMSEHALSPTASYDDIKRLVQNSAHTYPTGTAVDRHFELLEHLVRRYTCLFREFLERGDRISGRFLIHPSGSGSRYHDDHVFLGSYTLYLHSQWNCEWGGEQLAFEGKCPDLDAELKEAAFDNQRLNEYVMSLGTALAIMPRPNRLVLAAPRRLQKIARVDASAGHNLRMSMQGFLLSPDGPPEPAIVE